MPRPVEIRRSFARRLPNSRSHRRQIWLIAGFALGLSLAISSPWAKAASPTLATSSRAAREDAIRSIPFDKLGAELRAKVASTVGQGCVYRRLPVQAIDCDPDLYLFLVRHPEIVVNIWEVMNISNVALVRTGPDTFRATDNAGTLCEVKYCYSSFDTHLIYAEGSYSGPLLARPVRARCVLLLKSGYMQETNGRHFVTSRMDTFIQIDHVGVDLIAKTLQPLMHRSADYNFVETAAFFGTISRTAENNAAGLYRLAGKLTNTEPAVRERFAELTLEIGKKARQREAIQTSAVSGLPRSSETRVSMDAR
jgi:hypothetical protein